MEKLLLQHLLKLQKPERKRKRRKDSTTMTEEIERKFGTVKWFKAGKDGSKGSGTGYGFLTPDAGGPDVFAHISEVNRSGYETLLAGDRISYRLQTDSKSGRNFAVDLQLEHVTALSVCAHTSHGCHMSWDHISKGARKMSSTFEPLRRW
jgi:cold shock protein